LLYGIPAGSNVYSSGAGFYIEPKYNLTDNIAAGLRLEWAILGAADELGSSVSVSALASYLITGDYYLSTDIVRPYVGAGIGIYNVGKVEVSGSDLTGDAGSKLGFVPRVGILLGHLRTGLEYNIVTGFEGGNYLSWKFGFEIGGGRK